LRVFENSVLREYLDQEGGSNRRLRKVAWGGEISGSHGGKYENGCLLGYYARLYGYTTLHNNPQGSHLRCMRDNTKYYLSDQIKENEMSLAM
jgi:hypothetical protein